MLNSTILITGICVILLVIGAGALIGSHFEGQDDSFGKQARSAAKREKEIRRRANKPKHSENADFAGNYAAGNDSRGKDTADSADPVPWNAWQEDKKDPQPAETPWNDWPDRDTEEKPEASRSSYSATGNSSAAGTDSSSDDSSSVYEWLPQHRSKSVSPGVAVSLVVASIAVVIGVCTGIASTILEEEDDFSVLFDDDAIIEAETEEAIYEDSWDDDSFDEEEDLGDILWSEYFDESDPGYEASYEYDDLNLEGQVYEVAADQFDDAAAYAVDESYDPVSFRQFIYDPDGELVGYALWDYFDDWDYSPYADEEYPRGIAFFDENDDLWGYWFIYAEDDTECIYWKQWDAALYQNFCCQTEMDEDGHVDSVLFY